MTRHAKRSVGASLERFSEAVTRRSGSTPLVVFLIQRTQNKGALAMHVELNELVAAVKGASNRVVDIEALSEADLEALERHYAELARLAREDADPTASHSVEDARARDAAEGTGAKRS